MKTTIISMAILITVVTNCIAQTQTLVYEVWAEDKGTQTFFQKSVTKTDVNRNVYIAGATVNGNGNYDLLLTKYDSQGNELWTQQVAGSGSGDDFATAIFIDASSNVFVTGTVYESATNNNDIIVLKYNSSGTLQWDETYNGTSSGNDVGGDITIDGTDIYITGTSFNTSSLYDFVVIKYSSSGTQQWVSQWDNISLNDAANKISVNNGIIIVAGGTQVDVIKWQYAVVKYDASNGSELGYSVSGGSGTGIDKVTDIAQDASGNIYVTGGVVNTSVGYDCYTIKLDDDLAILWTATYNGNDNLDDIANSIDIDSQGNVYICGFTTTVSEGKNYVLIKYDASGNEQWVETYDRTDGNDEATALVLKSDTEIILTGMSSNGSNDDYYTIKYNDNADLVWSIAYNGEMNDKPTDIAMDNQGGIIVAGQSEIPGAIRYVTVKYEEVEAIIPPDATPCPSSFAFYTNRGQIIDDESDPQPDIKYYTTHHHPNLYFSRPIEEEGHRMLSYVFTHVDEDTTTTDTLHRVDLTFQLDEKIAEPVDLDTRPVSTEKNSQGHLNYFLPQCPQGITFVEGFNRLYYPSIFDNTDILFYGNNAGMKFYIILKPGAEPDVNLKFTEQDTIVVTDSTCRIVTSVGDYTYDRPDVFQIDANGDRQEVTFTPEYVDLGNGRVGFTLGSYDTGLPLVIEVGKDELPPAASATDNLKWCNYYGGSDVDYCHDVDNDDAHNMFVCGGTNTPGSAGNPFPLLNPLYTAMLTNLDDAFVIRFRQDPISGDLDTRFWATYYGGSLFESSTHIAIDGSNNVYLCGITGSNDLAGISSATSTFPNGETFAGINNNVFLVKFNPTGSIFLWGNYFNDSRNDRCDVDVDRFNNVYLASHARGTNVPIFQAATNTGSYFQTTPGGFANINLCKMNPAGTVMWCSYYGGNGTMSLSNLQIQKNGSTGQPDQVYIFGQVEPNTYTTNPCVAPSPINTFPWCNPGSGAYFQAAYGGNTVDAFIAEFSDDNAATANDNQMIWSTFFGGATGENALDGGAMSSTKIAGKTYLYIACNVKATNVAQLSNFPVASVPCVAPCYSQGFSSISGSTADICIAKFVDRDLQWISFYGGSGNEERPYSIAIDGTTAHEHAFLLGVTDSPNMSINNCTSPTGGDFPFCDNLPVNQAYYLETNYVAPNIRQAFITSFNTSNNEMEWSSYFGHNNAFAMNISGGGGYCNISLSEVTHQMYLGGYSRTLSNTDFPIYWQGGTSWQQQSNLSAISSDYDGIVARFDVLNPITSTNDINQTNSGVVSVFPNPSQNSLTFEFNSLKQGKVTLTIYDVLGRSYFNSELKVGKGKQKGEVDVSNLSPGMYFIKVSMDDNSASVKFVKE